MTDFVLQGLVKDTTGLITTAGVTVTVATTPLGKTWVVDPAGSDSNAGTTSSPFRTLQKAADSTNPGDLVLVNDGIYTGGSTVLAINRSGSSTAPILFRATNKWGAIVDGQNNASTTGIDISANYIQVQGFEVRGSNRAGIQAYNNNETVAGNHDVLITQNKIHDIGKVCADDTGGRVGINVYSSNVIVERNLIFNIGRFAPGESNCQPTTNTWQNHDHGIYHGVGDNVIVRNNIFYNNHRGWCYQRYNGGGARATGVWLVNNVFAFANPNRAGQIIIAGDTLGLVIANNIFYQATAAGIEWDASDGGTWAGAIVKNNISTNGISDPNVTGPIFTNNLINTDPKFMSPLTADFHLQAGSPAFNAGVVLTQVTDNFDGVLRTGIPNIGAY